MGIDQQARVADDLGQRGDVGNNRWQTAGHRLQRWQAKALVEGRVGQHLGGVVEIQQVLAGDPAHKVNAAIQIEFFDQGKGILE